MTPRLLTLKDLPAVAELEAACFHAPWSAEALKLLCTERHFGIGIFDDSGRALSYAGVMAVLEEGQITNVATAPDCRRKGYSRAVLSALIEEAEKRDIEYLTLEVRFSNMPARNLYESFGFFEIGRRPHFYTHPAEDALLYRFDIQKNR